MRRVVVLVALLALSLPAAAGAQFRGPFTSVVARDAPVDRNSAYWMGHLAAQHPRAYLNGPTGVFAPPVYEVDRNTPVRTVVCPFCGTFPGNGPTGWTDRIQVPIPDDAEPDPSADGHLALVDRARGIEWDLITAQRRPDGSWTATGAGIFDLRGDGHQDNAAGGGSATASRLPLSQAVSAAEVTRAIENGSFVIPHALQFTAPNVDRRCWVYPALGSDGSDAAGMPEGARIRLRPDVDVSGLPPAARVLARTLQVHGAFLRDVGGAFGFYLRAPRGDEPEWSALGLDGDAIASLSPTQFDVLRADYSVKGKPQPIETRAAKACAAKDFSAVAPALAGAPDRIPPSPPSRITVRAVGPRRIRVCWRPGRDETGVIGYYVSLDNRVVTKPTRRCTHPLRVRKGRHALSVTTVDAAGNQSTPGERSFRTR